MANWKHIYHKFEPVNDHVECGKRLVQFGNYFFSDPALEEMQLVDSESPEIHNDICADFFAMHKSTVISMPSEFAKTTLFMFYYVYAICYQIERFIVISGRSEKNCINEKSNLISILENHQQLHSCFGNFVPSSKNKMATKNRYTHKLTNGIMVAAIHVGGNIRSFKNQKWRVTFIGVDDADKPDDLNTFVITDKNFGWITRDAHYRLDARYGRICVAGNITGNGSVVQRLLNDPRWHHKNYLAWKEVTVNNKTQKISNWENRHPIKSLLWEEKQALNQGPAKYRTFLLERINLISKELDNKIDDFKVIDYDFIFDDNYNKYINIKNSPFSKSVYKCTCGIGVDPAFSTSKDADERAIVPIVKFRITMNDFLGLEVKDGDVNTVVMTLILSKHIVFEIEKHDKIIQRIFDLNKILVPDMAALESNGAQIIFTNVVQDGIYFDDFWTNKRKPYIESVANYKKAKEDRIYTTVGGNNNKILSGKSESNLMSNQVNLFNNGMFDKIHALDALEIIQRKLYAPSAEDSKVEINIFGNKVDQYYDRQANHSDDYDLRKMILSA